MCLCTHRNPVLCAVPPYVLRKIAEKQTGKTAEDALRTMSIDTTFRMMRAVAIPRINTRGMAATPTADPVPQRTIYTANHQQTIPGTVVRTEGQNKVGDAAVDEAYDGLGATFEFYRAIFQRNSIDDEGLPLEATVHYGDGYDNAFWNGERMIFGDGDGEYFNRFTISIDVIGHELTHGVTQDEAQLMYQFQSGALNESISDVFGSLIKQYLLKQTTDKADWLIGAGLFTSKVMGKALRSMAQPGTAFDDPDIGKDPQPGHLKDYVQTTEDNGGVHINSGIPNKAFYLAATKIGGFAWEKAGRIWYETLRDNKLRPNTGFRSFAQLTQAVAARLYGAQSDEAAAVQDAWAQVGLGSKKSKAAGGGS